MSNFRANRKEAIWGNVYGVLPIFWTFYDKKIDIGRWQSAISNQRSGPTVDAIFNGCRLSVWLEVTLTDIRDMR